MNIHSHQQVFARRTHGSTHFAFWLVPVIGLTLCGCDRFGGPRIVGSGVSKTETREVASFDRIKLEGAYKLDVTIGSEAPLTITADDNILPVIRTQSSDGRLEIKLLERIRPKTTVTVSVGVTHLQSIEADGAGKIKLSGVDNDKLVVELSGGYAVWAAGKTKSLDLSVTGAGEVDTSDLKASEVKVAVIGAGDVLIDAEDSLDANITGAGSVQYLGDPKVTKQILGAGRVSKK